MESSSQRMIRNLSPAIAQKCEELRAARRERLYTRIFVLLCILAILVPTLSVFAGLSLTLFAVPVAFMSCGVLLLLPVLLFGKGENHGGVQNEKT